MKRLFPAIVLFIGFLTVFLPHFGLPMDLYRTITMAYDRPIPRWWTHTELYMGVLLIITGMYALTTRDDNLRARLLLVSACIGVLVTVQGVLLVPFSGWMLWMPAYERSYQAEVIRLHRGIVPVLTGLGFTVFAAAVAGRIWLSRYPKGLHRRAGFISVAGANLFRKPFRTVAVMLISTFAAGMTFFASYALLATLASGRLSVSRFGADIIVVPEGYEPSTRDVILGGEPVEFVMPGDTLESVRGVAGVMSASPQLYIKALPYRGCCAVLNMLVVGFDPETDFTVRPWIDYTIKDGLRPGDAMLGYHVMFAPGQRVQLFNEYARVTGMLSPTGMEFFDTSAFISLDYAYELAANFPRNPAEGADIRPGSISSVLVRVVPGAGVEKTATDIRAVVPGVDVIQVKSLLPPARLWLLSSVEQLWPLMVLVWGLCCSFLVFAFFMIFNERLREVGIMRALGATRGWIFRMFLAEAGFIVGIGSVIGVSCGWLATIVYRQELVKGATVRFQLPGLGETAMLFAACALMGLLAGLASALFPAYRASSAEPYDAIRKGE